MSVEVKVTVDNTEKVLDLSEAAVKKALTEIGLQAERNAKSGCVVDTGLLRNSITFALDGEPARTQEYKADNGPGTGRYKGAAPAEGDGSRAVYIGTNVEYGPYIELGTSRMNAKPFLRPAIQDHQDEYREIIKKNMENA